MLDSSQPAPGVLLIEMDRPVQRNALDRALTDALDGAFAQLDSEPALRVAVLAGRGPVFSAGTDLHAPASPATPHGGEYGLVRRRRTKPVIAAVEGTALGGGFELALSCDLIVAGANASFGLPEVARGLVPACGGLFRGPDRLPPNVATELMLTGDRLEAARAERLGLVNILCPAGQAITKSLALAERIIRNSPAAIAASMAALHEIRGADESLGWTATARALDTMRQSPDGAEGVAAFFEKRSPVWSVKADTGGA
jgi:enoyl-CoA hydratase